MSQRGDSAGSMTCLKEVANLLFHGVRFGGLSEEAEPEA
jgi:hypothetical protein